MRLTAASKAGSSLGGDLGMADDWISRDDEVALDRYYHALGVIHARWTVVELQFQQIIWRAMGVPEAQIGGAVTFDMGNVARANLLLTLIREIQKDAGAIDMVEHVAKLFNRNRENRNFLSHCRILHPDNTEWGEVAVLQGFRADGKFRTKMYLAGLWEIRRVADDIRRMSVFFSAVVDAPQWPASLDRPPLPRTLAESLLSFDPSDSLPPESSQA